MAAEDIRLAMLKADLGFFAPDENTTTYMNQLLRGAESRLKDKGIHLDPESVDDNLLVSSFAAWLYRKRASDGPMPEQLRYNIRNRIVQDLKAVES